MVLLQRLRFSPWPGSFYILLVRLKKREKKKKRMNNDQEKVSMGNTREKESTRHVEALEC